MSLIPTEREEKQALESSSSEREILPKKSLAIAAVTAIESKEKVDTVKNITEQLLKGAMKFEDVECDPNIKTFYESHMVSFEINPRLSKKLYKEESEMVNSASSWIQELAGQAEYYYMSEMIEPFFKSFRMFCRVLQDFNDNLRTSEDTEDLKRHFRTLKFAFKKLEKSYEETLELFGEREEDEYYAKPWYSKLWANKWSMLKWIWKYKYGLYITGSLLYNGYTYVGLPFTDWFDTLIKVVGTICFTFASDKVAMTKLLGVVTAVVSGVVWFLYNLIPGAPDLEEMGQKIPEAIKSSYNGVKAAFFYIFLWFSLDFVSYLVKTICQGILIFGAGYKAGTTALSGIWVIFNEAAEEIQGKVSNAYNVIFKFIEETGGSIAEGMSLIFVDIIGKNVVGPLFDMLKNLPSNVWSAFTEGMSDLVFGPKTMPDVTGKEIALTPEQEERLNMIALVAEDGGKQVAALLTEKRVELSNVVNGVVAQLKKDIKQYGSKVYEDVEKQIFNSLEDTMKIEGTYKLYKATVNLTVGLYTTEQTVMFFVILAIFSWLVSMW